MDIQKIENFLALAKTLSFTKAADSVFKTQSVLSRQIVAMEEELGMKLCVRTKRSVELTPAGEILADGLKKVLALYDSVVDEAKAVNSGFVGSVRLSVISAQTICDTLGPVLSSFSKKMPGIKVDVITKNVSTIRQMLMDDTIDFAYGREIDFGKLKGVAFLPLFDVDVCYVASKNFSGNGVLSRVKDESELDKYPFIWTNELRSQMVDKMIYERQLRCGDSNMLFAPDLSTMHLWIEIGRGYSLLNTASHFVHNPAVTYFPLPGVTVKEGLIWKTDNKNPCVNYFIDFAEQYVGNFHFK